MYLISGEFAYGGEQFGVRLFSSLYRTVVLWNTCIQWIFFQGMLI